MFNLHSFIRNTRVLLMVVTIGIPGWASAEVVQWEPKQDNAGFTVMMPSINIDVLVDEITRLKSSLKHDESILMREESKMRAKGSNNMLSYLLPGGLVYAAYKKISLDRVVQEQELVSAQLKEITTDLVALTTINGPLRVARR